MRKIDWLYVAFGAALTLSIGVFAGVKSARSAELVCGPYVAMKEQLQKKYSEQKRFSGLSDDGNLVEFWSAENSWTLIAVTPAGISCVIAAGDQWTESKPVPNGPES